MKYEKNNIKFIVCSLFIAVNCISCSNRDDYVKYAIKSQNDWKRDTNFNYQSSEYTLEIKELTTMEPFNQYVGDFLLAEDLGAMIYRRPWGMYINLRTLRDSPQFEEFSNTTYYRISSENQSYLTAKDRIKSIPVIQKSTSIKVPAIYLLLFKSNNSDKINKTRIVALVELNINGDKILGEYNFQESCQHDKTRSEKFISLKKIPWGNSLPCEQSVIDLHSYHAQ